MKTKDWVLFVLACLIPIVAIKIHNNTSIRLECFEENYADLYQQYNDLYEDCQNWSRRYERDMNELYDYYGLEIESHHFDFIEDYAAASEYITIHDPNGDDHIWDYLTDNDLDKKRERYRSLSFFFFISSDALPVVPVLR